MSEYCPVNIKDPEGQDDFDDSSTSIGTGDSPDTKENLIEGDFQTNLSEIR